jgi:hypothetical protein
MDDELRDLESRKTLAERIEYAELRTQISAYAFPSGELSRIIHRWETTFRNLESRTLNELIQVRKLDLNETTSNLKDDGDFDDM